MGFAHLLTGEKMPAIAATSIKGYGAIATTETTLDGSDSLTYNRDALLILRNSTSGALSPVIDGGGGTTVEVSGLGNVSVAGGYSVGSIAVGGVIVIRLNTINEYLRGAIAITSGSGLTAVLLEG